MPATTSCSATTALTSRGSSAMADYRFGVNKDGQLQLRNSPSTDTDTLLGIESVEFGDLTLGTGTSNLDAAQLKTATVLSDLVTHGSATLSALNGVNAQPQSQLQLAQSQT